MCQLLQLSAWLSRLERKRARDRHWRDSMIVSQECVEPEERPVGAEYEALDDSAAGGKQTRRCVRAIGPSIQMKCVLQCDMGDTLQWPGTMLKWFGTHLNRFEVSESDLGFI